MPFAERGSLGLRKGGLAASAGGGPCGTPIGGAAERGPGVPPAAERGPAVPPAAGRALCGGRSEAAG